jgi:hypothetical protein
MSGFHRSASGRLTARFDAVERSILIGLADQLIAFMTPDEELDPDADPLSRIVGLDLEARSSAPEDPALARLLPSAYRDDDEAAADFRRFTERSLREAKMSHARTMRHTLERSGEKIALSQPEANAWLIALNDARLALGTRLSIVQDDPRFADPESLPDDDPEAATFHVYDWISHLQDTLVRALSRVM